MSKQPKATITKPANSPKPKNNRMKGQRSPFAPNHAETVTTEADSPVEDFACNEEAETASSPSNLNPAVATTSPVNQPEAPAQEKKAMSEITLKRSDAPRKTNRLVIYNLVGRNGSVQFLSTLFGGSQKDRGNPPETLTLVGEFAEPKAPKAKMTAEERKAARKNAPKPTLAEKLAKAQARMEALKAKLAAEAAPVAE